VIGFGQEPGETRSIVHRSASTKVLLATLVATLGNASGGDVASPADSSVLATTPLAGVVPQGQVPRYSAGVDYHAHGADKALVQLSTSGEIKVRNGSAGAVHFILDVNGWYE
jgi:hypothetical protein